MMFRPTGLYSVAQPQVIESQQTLWKDDSSSAVTLTIPNALVISVSGRLKYQHFVEICFYAAKRWRPKQEQLVLDFSKMRFGESAGIRYIANQLHAAASQSGGQVYFVRIPPTAKAYLDRTCGGGNLHFAQSLGRVVSKLPASPAGPPPSSVMHPPRPATGRNPQKSNLQARIQSANSQRPIVK